MMNKTVCNPRELTDLWDGREIGDPFIMRHDGRFYLYCSSHGWGPGVKCWVSDDMIRFTYYGYVCEDERIHGAYAPEVAYNNGKFYMVTSPVGSGHYMLRADSPLGPFEVISDNYGIGIDGSLFVDDDGSSWFYRASHQGIRVHRMPAPDRIDVRSEVIEESFLGHWTEGPQVIKRDGRYFLTDTGNHVLSRGYHVDYCVSHDGPDRGYRRLRDAVLLLETRDEYHALGHSSTCVGPDMDTMYIIYHKNILDACNRPLHRSMNMDRLYFNGDRMYCNATWWEQPAPKQPVCACRGAEGMTAHPLGLALPERAGDTYTAEINFLLDGDQGSVFFSAEDDRQGVLTLQHDRKWRCSLAGRQYGGVLPSNVCMDALLTVKASMRRGKLVLCVNGMEILRQQTPLGGGAIGLGSGCRPSFAAFSDAAQGSGDAQAAKSVPGAFDAVHHTGSASGTAEGERGCTALVLRAGDTAVYPINVWQQRSYHLAMTVKACADEIALTVNGLPMTAQPTGTAGEDGMEKRWFGTIQLPAGEQTLEICAAAETTIDRIFLTEADELSPAVLIERGEDVSGGRLQVIGHKQQRSMHRKFSGYTCAEGYGEAYFGGSWRDCEVRMTINMTACSPDAQVSAYIRSSRESWHPHQVKAARRAYALHVYADRLVLARQEYGETILAQAPLAVEWGGTLDLVLRAAGSRIAVLRDNEVVLMADDPMALTCGRVGIDASGDGMGFAYVEVCVACRI